MSSNSSGSPAASAPYAEASQEADQGAVRSLSSPHSPEDAGGGRGDGASSAYPMPFAEVIQEAEQAAIRPLFGAALPQPGLSGTGVTYRHNWGRRRGQWTLRLNWGLVNPRSRVLASIGEGAAGGPDDGKFIGTARYTLHNVAPRAGGVDIRVNIEWGSDILLYVDYLVVNP